MAKKYVEPEQDQKTKQQVALWHDRINVSRKWRDSVETEGGWKRFIEEYKGKYEVVLGNILVPPINEVYAYVQSSIAILFSRNPYIAVNPKKSGSVLGARIAEAAVNYVWRELEIKPEVEREIIDAILVGHSWHKTGTDVRLSGSGDLLKLESNRIFSNRVSWKDVFFNPGTMNPIKDCRWVAHRIYMPIEDMKEQFGAIAANIQGVSTAVIKDDTYRNALFKEDIRYGCLYEIFSAKDRMIYTVASEIPDKYLRDPRPWPEYWESFPFSFMQFNPLNDEAYGLSDIAPFEPQVLEKIKVFTMALNHVKRWNRQMLIKKQSMSDQDIDKFEKGIDGSILEVAGNLSDVAKTLDFGSLPPDIYAIIERLDAIKRSVNGQPEFIQGGQAKSSTRTLGELELISGGAQGRVQRKIDVIEAHIEDIAKKILANLQNQFPVDLAVKLTGKAPEEIVAAFEGSGKYDPVSNTISFTAEDIKGEYDVTVKAGSTLPLDKMTRDQILDRLIELAIPLAQAPSIPPFLQELITERLRAYDMPSLEVAFAKQTEALDAQQEQQSQVQGVEAEKIKAETAKRMAQATHIDTETDIARAQAMAKATGLIPLDVKA